MAPETAPFSFTGRPFGLSERSRSADSIFYRFSIGFCTQFRAFGTQFGTQFDAFSMNFEIVFGTYVADPARDPKQKNKRSESYIKMHKSLCRQTLVVFWRAAEGRHRGADCSADSMCSMFWRAAEGRLNTVT
jgi:hypothetical protein